MPLRRTLGSVSLTFYAVGLILGAGIYSLLGKAAGVAGEALWMSFLVGSVVALLTGLSYAELATMFPEAGAEYVYLRRTWPRVRWLPGSVAWALIAASTATAATVALAFGGYWRVFFDVPIWITAGALLLAAGALNVIGIRETSYANILITLVEASGLVALVIVGMRHPGFADAIFATPHAGVLAGAGLIFFAFLGFENVANLAEEARDPDRGLPRAILGAVVVTTVVYVLVALASVTLLSPEALAGSDSPLADAMRVAAPRLAGALAGVALFATANTALISLTAASRLLLGLARGGDAPAPFARILEARGTPATGLAFVVAVSFVFLLVGAIELVGSVASLMSLVAFALVNAALIRLRFSQPDARRPFRVPLALGRLPVLTVLGFAVTLFLLAQFEPLAYGIGLAALLVGFAFERIPWGQRVRR